MVTPTKETSRVIVRLPTGFMALFIALVLLATPTLQGQEYLSTGEVATIGGGAAAVFGLAHLVGNADSTRNPLIGGPLPLEASLQRWLGGRCSLGQTNFLDNKRGSSYTAITAALLLVSADLAWPRYEKGKELGQDLFLFTSGVLATQGATSLLKTIVARPRPLLCLEPELAGQRKKIDNYYDRQSFPSGHTSSAFFACAYLNLRLRAIMRRELHAGEYRDYRWLPPTVLFSWASFVGWSRIHAYKHFVSDVMVGAAVGVLMAELFYQFADDPDVTDNVSGGAPMVVSYRWTF
ncbi:MAG: phosphatase PAP2 family protein [candidate division Zixibacteria bacterium]|nr:phosphatase PAP2 family protein [candidate division Zixibacteria bacterium]MDH3938806.1 phosphatase PAP2 family protein [candidate division Zixibacteria bacterium]MDH4032268.1 phosphatase PAP2 family protein [candidate division Zixibacteria bacterium]